MMSVRMPTLSPSLTRPMAMPATGALSGTPASMTDIAAAGVAEALDLARGERREVVVKHEGPVAVALERLHLLLVVLGAERRRDQGLGLAAREERRTVGPGQVARLGPDRTHFLDAASVDADPLVHDQPQHLGLLDLVELLARLGLRGRLVGHVV